MPRCNHCGAQHGADELVRHEYDSLVIVHCPECNCLMGQYNPHVHRE